eukprot:gene5010-4694_t
MLPHVKLEVVGLARHVFALQLQAQGEKVPAAELRPEFEVLAERLAAWIAEEVRGSAVYDFPTGRPARPSVLIETLRDLLCGV